MKDDRHDGARGHVSTLDVFLETGDLDALAVAREALDGLTAEEEARASELVLGPGGQERANLLMYPGLLPESVRHDALLRALREGTGSYAALAAAVGVGDVDARTLPEERRAELLEALLDLVASDAGVAGTRAAMALQGLMTSADGADVVPLLVHPVPAVRRNLLAALLGVLDPADLRALLDSPGFVGPDDADAVRRRLDEDGVRLDDDLLAPMPSLPLLPNRVEWHA